MRSTKIYVAAEENIHALAFPSHAIPAPVSIKIFPSNKSALPGLPRWAVNTSVAWPRVLHSDKCCPSVGGSWRAAAAGSFSMPLGPRMNWPLLAAHSQEGLHDDAINDISATLVELENQSLPVAKMANEKEEVREWRRSRKITRKSRDGEGASDGGWGGREGERKKVRVDHICRE